MKLFVGIALFAGLAGLIPNQAKANPLASFCISTVNQQFYSSPSKEFKAACEKIDNNYALYCMMMFSDTTRKIELGELQACGKVRGENAKEILSCLKDAEKKYPYFSEREVNNCVRNPLDPNH